MAHVEEITIRTQSWDELLGLLLSNDLQGWVFRGQACAEWSVTSSLQRALEGAESVGIPLDLEQRAIGYFKDRARASGVSLPEPDEVLRWLALMQHYRAPTRLIDWTVSPLVATYFACADQLTDEDAAIWILNSAYCRSVFGMARMGPIDHLGVSSTETYTDGELVSREYDGRESMAFAASDDLVRGVIERQESFPLPIVPPTMDQRMLAQRAVFTCSGVIDRSLDQILLDRDGWQIPSGSGRWFGVPHVGGFDPDVKTEHVLRRLIVPAEWRQQVLSSLSLLGVSADTLFPGLDGVGLATSLFIATGGVDSVRDYLQQ